MVVVSSTLQPDEINREDRPFYVRTYVRLLTLSSIIDKELRDEKNFLFFC